MGIVLHVQARCNPRSASCFLIWAQTLQVRIAQVLCCTNWRCTADLVPIAFEQWRCICVAVDRNLDGALVDGRPQSPRQVKDSLELGQ